MNSQVASMSLSNLQTAPPTPKQEASSDYTPSPIGPLDIESQQPQQHGDSPTDIPVIKGLGWLDRLLALWILLAMIVGVLLGNFVEESGPALQKGKFVGVSIPIGAWRLQFETYDHTDLACSDRTARHDVPNTLQSALRKLAPSFPPSRPMGTDWVQHCHELDRGALSHGKHSSHIIKRALTDQTCQLGLSWAFLPDKSGLREGLILVGLARCIAMVRVLSISP